MPSADDTLVNKAEMGIPSLEPRLSTPAFIYKMIFDLVAKVIE